MPTQRKIFRIEEYARGKASFADADAPAQPSADDDLMAEIKALRALLEIADASRPPVPETPLVRARELKAEIDAVHDAIRRTKNEFVALDNDALGSAPIARVADELDAVVAGTEQATKRILETAEEIDRSASLLTAALKNSHERELAQDIRDGLAHVFEACNFHDFTGQRVTKVMKTFAAIEQHILRMREIWGVMEQGGEPAPIPVQAAPSHPIGLLNGPKLPGDAGHFSQAEIDSMFA